MEAAGWVYYSSFTRKYPQVTDFHILKEVYPSSRMWRRGANLEGDVANFIETEQLAEFEGFKSSLLQRLCLGRILEFLNVPGLTRENIASHLQELWQRLQALVLRQKRDALFCFCFSCLLLVWVVIG